MFITKKTSKQKISALSIFIIAKMLQLSSLRISYFVKLCKNYPKDIKHLDRVLWLPRAFPGSGIPLPAPDLTNDVTSGPEEGTDSSLGHSKCFILVGVERKQRVKIESHMHCNPFRLNKC